MESTSLLGCHDAINDLPNSGQNGFMWTDNTLYLGPWHQFYCNDVPIQGVPPHPPHHHNNQVFFLVSPMTCTKRMMFRMQGTTDHNQGREKMTIFFNHFQLVMQYHIQESLLCSLLPPSTFSEFVQQDSTKKRTTKNVSNMTRLSFGYYVAIFT